MNNQEKITVYDYMALSDPNACLRYIQTNGYPQPRDIKQVSKALQMIIKNGGEDKLSEMFMELHPDAKGIMQLINNGSEKKNSELKPSCECSKKFHSACGCSHNAADGEQANKELTGAEILANAINAANAIKNPPAPALDPSIAIEMRNHKYITVGLAVVTLIGLAYMLGSNQK